jgi:transposase
MREDTRLTIGLDLGDQWADYCELDGHGAVVSRNRVRTTSEAFTKRFSGRAGCRIALEAGTHSQWVARLLNELQLEVIIANPRRVRLITCNDKKSDTVDAELLARLARVDPQLLSPIEPRAEQIQADRVLISTRDTTVRVRTMLINHVRGCCKAFGTRLPKSSAEAFPRKAPDFLPEVLRTTLDPQLAQIDALSRQIKTYDKQIDQVSEERYPITSHLRLIRGVGPITSLAYVLAIGDPHRFSKSRKVGSYLGLVPRRDQSGARDPQLRITKAGDPLVRKLLLQCAHYILGAHGEDCDLRRWAEARVPPGDRGARKRALVAVARKLAVRMHRLWITGEIYDPLRLARARNEVTAA